MSERSTAARDGVAVIACAWLAYAAALLGTFVYDDLHTVRDNDAIRSLGNIPSFFTDVGLFSSLDCRMYRPLLLVSYAIDWAIGQGAAWPFKLTNLLLHSGVSLVLLRLLVRLDVSRRAALLFACLFAAHPLASEAVNTISGRSELGLLLGLLLGLHAHLRARDDARFALATAGCAVLACGCKEIGVVLPALLLVLDPPCLKDRRGRRVWWVRHLPAAVVVAGYLLVRRILFGCATAAPPPWTGGTEPMAGYGRDLLTQACTMATLLPRALAQAVFPFGLSLDPPVRFVSSPWTGPVVCGAAFVVAVLAIAARRAAGDVARRTGLALACLTALPWIVLPLNLPYLEHRMYVPLAGIAAAVAAAGAAATRGAAPTNVLRPGGRVLAGTVLAAYAVVAGARSLEYRDPAAMWQRLIDRQPTSVRGLCGRALCHLEAGELAPALTLVQRAVALWPTHASALRNLAELNIKLAPAPGNAIVALVAADKLVRMAPDDPFDRLLRSRALALAAEMTGHQAWFDDAEAEALHCLAVAAPKALVYRTAASARARQGDHARAVALLDASIEAGLVTVDVWLDRAASLRQLGREAEAEVAVQRALALDPFDPAVLAFLRRPARPQ